VERGLALVPGSPAANVVAARLDLAAGRPALARDRLRLRVREHRGTPNLAYWLARAEIAAGEPEAARRHLEAAATDGGRGLQLAGLRAWLAASAGDPAAARRLAEPLRALGADSEVWYLHQTAAEAAAAVGDREGALERLRRAVARGGLDLRDLAADPALACLAGDPELEELLAEMERRVRLLRRRLGLDPRGVPRRPSRAPIVSVAFSRPRSAAR
jgi:predicted Zn-dependent protease